MRRIKDIWSKLSIKNKVAIILVSLVSLPILFSYLDYRFSHFYYAMRFERMLEEDFYEDHGKAECNWTFSDHDDHTEFDVYECYTEENIVRVINVWNQYVEDYPNYAKKSGIVVIAFYDEAYGDTSKIAEVTLYSGDRITNTNLKRF